MDYYDMLGVRKNAAALELELAYKGRRAQYHPDRYAGADAETLQWATRRMQEINEAYAVLTDAARRRQYDERCDEDADEEDRPAESGRAAETQSAHAAGKGASQGATLVWRDYIALTPLPELESTSRRQFFAPNIPASKLHGALARYGRSVRPNDVVALVDDTVWGGAERGAIFTNTRVMLNDLQAACVWDFEQIDSIGFSADVVRVNGREAARFQLQDEAPTGFLFARLDDYLACARRAGLTTAAGIDLPLKELAAVCARSMGTRAFREHGICSIWPDIAPPVQASVRFLLGLGADEEIAAVCHSSALTRTDCFAVTRRGVHAKTGPSWVVLPWKQLRPLQVLHEFRDGIRCGVALSDGTRIVCSNARADGQTFGANLFGALSELLQAHAPF